MLLDLVDDLGVFEDRAVVPEVDGLGLVGEHLDFAAGIVVAFFEGREGGGGAAAEVELGGDFAPVELCGCSSL